MEKIKVRFMRYKNVLIAEIISFPEELRCEEIGKRIKTLGYRDDGYEVRSYNKPELVEKRLYLRGCRREKDTHVVSYDYSSQEEAIQAQRAFEEIIAEINSREDE